MTVHLDTHVAVWLYESGPRRLPSKARRLLEREPLQVSPMVGLELALLGEIGRITPTRDTILDELRRAIGLAVSPEPFTAVAEAAAEVSWTRDPFDRMICAQAAVADALLLTRDHRIRANLTAARWD